MRLINSLPVSLSLSPDPTAMATLTRVVVNATVRLMAIDCHWSSATNSTWLNPAASRTVSRPAVGRSSGLRTQALACTIWPRSAPLVGR